MKIVLLKISAFFMGLIFVFYGINTILKLKDSYHIESFEYVNPPVLEGKISPYVEGLVSLNKGYSEKKIVSQITEIMDNVFEADNLSAFEREILNIWDDSEKKPEVKINNSNYLGFDYVRFASARDDTTVLIYRPKVYVLVFWDGEEAFSDEYYEFYANFINIFNPKKITDETFFERIRLSQRYYLVFTDYEINEKEAQELVKKASYPQYLLKEDISELKKKYESPEDIEVLLKGELYRGFIESIFKGEYYLKVPGRKEILDKLQKIIEGLDEKPADFIIRLSGEIK